jgi:hypothetical protein
MLFLSYSKSLKGPCIHKLRCPSFTYRSISVDIVSIVFYSLPVLLMTIGFPPYVLLKGMLVFVPAVTCGY